MCKFVGFLIRKKKKNKIHNLTYTMEVKSTNKLMAKKTIPTSSH